MNDPAGALSRSASSRRNFIAFAGAGAAAAAAAVVVPVNSTGRATVLSPNLPEGAEAMLAHIKDVSSGEIALMVSGREVVVTDHELVARLAHAIASVTA